MIEFHCEHCNKVIKARDEEGGQQGKCPHCKGVNYIPLAEADSGEIPLAPLDMDEERRIRRAAAEDFALQRKLREERAAPGEPGRRRPRSIDVSPTPSAPRPSNVGSISDKQVNSLVVQYIEAMAGGNLEKAESIASQLQPHKDMVQATLNEITSSGSANAYGLPTLPKPVLLGFVRQLQSRL